MRRRPSGANIAAISSSEKPAELPSAISASFLDPAGREHAAPAAPADRLDQPLLFVEPQRRGPHVALLCHFADIENTHGA
jgi:hypothetical protein